MACTVTFQPIGRRVSVPAGTALLDAARLAGVDLVAICGGEGNCGACRVRPREGALTPLTSTEEAELPAADMAAGLRLACQARVLGDAQVDIPPESLTTPQRLQLEGQERAAQVDPLVTALDLQVPPPGLHDLRADLARVIDTAAEHGCTAACGLAAAAALPHALRMHGWRVRLALRAGEIVGVVPPGASLYGLAIDVGTTKLAAYLVDLESGNTAARAGAMNPQIAYGEDVISRIAYATDHAHGARVLQDTLVAALNRLVDELRGAAAVAREQIVEAVVVGNTAMHHLFAGLPVRQLGAAPYVPAVSEALLFPAAQIGLPLAPGARVFMPPNVAGYVGADHIAMLLGAGLAGPAQTTAAIDIGTNAEISLFHGGRHWSCSCASGPAFEGAHIRDGMRAAPGAVERVRLAGDEVQVQTIDGRPAAGICGSGILDAVAALRGAGLLEPRGALAGDHPRLRVRDGQAEFVLVPASATAAGRDVGVTRRDVNEVQLAKGAIRAGLEVLLAEAGIGAESIASFVVAGAFGTYLDLDSACRIGMFPDLPRERFRQVGNAAGTGARHLLLSARLRNTAAEIARRVEYVELAGHPAFTALYAKALIFR